MVKKIIICILLIFFSAYATVQPWTWVYSVVCDQQQPLLHVHNCHITWQKLSTPLFNQLIFSWNALRPQAGHFIFRAQVRDATTKQWYDWHTMHAWGNGTQKSFRQAQDNSTHYYHVRLELPAQKYADAVKIRIEPIEKADLACIKSFHVNICNLAEFQPEQLDKNVFNTMPSCMLQGVVPYSQMVLDHPKKEIICSPTSCAMLTTYLTKRPIDPSQFADNVYDEGLNAFGSWPYNTAHVFEHAHENFYIRVQRMTSFIDLYAMLQRDLPIVVSVRGDLVGAPKVYNNGHLLLVVGWQQSEKKVICYDPAFVGHEKVITTYDIDSFMRAWERSRRLAYCVYRR